MDNLTFYEQSIQRIAEIKKLDLYEAAEYLQEELQRDPETIMRLVSIRKQFLTKEDANTGLYHFIQSNYFPQQIGDNLDALISMVLEITDASRIYYQLLAFEKYNSSQPIFQKHPELYQKIRTKTNGNPDLELRITSYNVCYTKLLREVIDNSKILAWPAVTHRWNGSDYYVDHAPVRDQRTVEGHAVRALYLYSAMADQTRLRSDRWQSPAPSWP